MLPPISLESLTHRVGVKALFAVCTTVVSSQVSRAFDLVGYSNFPNQDVA